MIIVIGLSHHQQIYFEQVGGSIIHFEIDITIFMRKPINDHTLYRK